LSDDCAFDCHFVSCNRVRVFRLLFVLNLEQESTSFVLLLLLLCRVFKTIPIITRRRHQTSSSCDNVISKYFEAFQWHIRWYCEV